MQRQTVYPGQEVLETDLLGAQRGVYIGFCKLGESLMGSASAIHHMPCAPGTGLSVEVGPGELYMNQADDATAWSSLEADSTTMLKQGLSLTTQSLSTPAPPTSGQSIVYLIEGQVQQTDGGAAVLPYYSSADPTAPLLGPGGSSQSNTTTRNDVLALQVKAGTAATTGTETAPTADSGWVPMWTVTVAYGATSIVQSDIAVASGAPFIAMNLGTLGTVLTVSEPLTIGSADVGMVLNCAAALTLSLPSAAQVQNGFGFGFVATGGTVTLAPNGSDPINGANADWTLGQYNTAYVTRGDLGEWVITESSVYTGSQYTLIGSVALPGKSSAAFTSIPPIWSDLFLEFVGVSSTVNLDALDLGQSVNNGSSYASGQIGAVSNGGPVDCLIEMRGYTGAVGHLVYEVSNDNAQIGSDLGATANTGGTGGVSSTTLTLTAVQSGWASQVGDEVWYAGMATPSLVTTIPSGGTTGAYTISPAADIPSASTVYMRHVNMIGAVNLSAADAYVLGQKHSSAIDALELSLGSGTFATGALYLYGK